MNINNVIFWLTIPLKLRIKFKHSEIKRSAFHQIAGMELRDLTTAFFAACRMKMDHSLHHKVMLILKRTPFRRLVSSYLTFIAVSCTNSAC